MERFLAEVTTAAWNHELDAGRPFAEAIAELQHAHPQHADLIAAYWDRWPEMLGEVNSDTAEIVSALRGAWAACLRAQQLVGRDVPTDNSIGTRTVRFR